MNYSFFNVPDLHRSFREASSFMSFPVAVLNLLCIFFKAVCDVKMEGRGEGVNDVVTERETMA